MTAKASSSFNIIQALRTANLTSRTSSVTRSVGQLQITTTTNPTPMPVYANDNDDEYSDEETPLGNTTPTKEKTENPDEPTLSPKELNLIDESQSLMVKQPHTRWLTKLDLNRINIDPNQKVINRYYRRPDYFRCYTVIVQYLEDRFLQTDDQEVLDIDFKVDEPGVIYEYTQQSQPCFYFSVSMDSNGYMAVENSDICRWYIHLPSKIMGASRVQVVVDDPLLVGRIKSWIKFDMAVEGNKHYGLVNEAQMRALTMTTDVYQIVASMVTKLREVNTPPKSSDLQPPSVPDVEYDGMSIDDGTPYPTLKKPTIFIPKLISAPKLPMVDPGTKKGGVKRAFEEDKTEDSPLVVPTAKTVEPPVNKPKRRRLIVSTQQFTFPTTTTTTTTTTSIPLVVSDKDQPVTPSGPQPPSLIAPVPLPVDNLQQLDKDKRKLINVLIDLTMLYKHSMTKAMGQTFVSIKQGEENIPLSNIHSIVGMVVEDDEANVSITNTSDHPPSDGEADVGLLDIYQYMDGSHASAFEATLNTKKDALIHALICWLKLQTHVYINNHVELLTIDNPQKGPAADMVMAEFAKNPNKPELKQTIRNSRLAEAFPGAFCDFINQLQHYEGKSLKKKVINELVMCLRHINGLKTRYAKLSENVRIMAKTLNEFPPEAVDQKKSIDSIYWMWEQDRGSPFNSAKFGVLELYFVDKESNTIPGIVPHYIIASIGRNRKAKTYCEFFLEVINMLSQFVAVTIPNHMVEAKKRYDEALRLKAMVTSDVSGPTIEKYRDSFAFYFITGTTLDSTLPDHAHKTFPFTSLVDDVKKQLISNILVLTSV